MTPLLKQIKNRRLQLRFKQQDMLLRIGMSRQQYQRLESKGNPRLETLELIAKGLNSELLLIPREKLEAVLAVLADDVSISASSASKIEEHPPDPWQWLLGDEDEQS